MNEFKIISLDGDNATVSLDSIVKFSGNKEKVIQKHVRNNIERLIKNGLSFPPNQNVKTVLMFGMLKYA